MTKIIRVGIKGGALPPSLVYGTPLYGCEDGNPLTFSNRPAISIVDKKTVSDEISELIDVYNRTGNVLENTISDYDKLGCPTGFKIGDIVKVPDLNGVVGKHWLREYKKPWIFTITKKPSEYLGGIYWGCDEGALPNNIILWEEPGAANIDMLHDFSEVHADILPDKWMKDLECSSSDIRDAFVEFEKTPSRAYFLDEYIESGSCDIMIIPKERLKSLLLDRIDESELQYYSTEFLANFIGFGKKFLDSLQESQIKDILDTIPNTTNLVFNTYLKYYSLSDMITDQLAYGPSWGKVIVHGKQYYYTDEY